MVVWQADGGCHFVIFKTGERAYRCQFFYKPDKQMGTGVSNMTIWRSVPSLCSKPRPTRRPRNAAICLRAGVDCLPTRPTTASSNH